MASGPGKCTLCHPSSAAGRLQFRQKISDMIDRGVPAKRIVGDLNCSEAVVRKVQRIKDGKEASSPTHVPSVDSVLEGEGRVQEEADDDEGFDPTQYLAIDVKGEEGDLGDAAAAEAIVADDDACAMSTSQEEKDDRDKGRPAGKGGGDPDEQGKGEGAGLQPMTSGAKEGGESLTPQFAGGTRNAAAAAENADVTGNEEVPPASEMEGAGQHSLEGNGTGL